MKSKNIKHTLSKQFVKRVEKFKHLIKDVEKTSLEETLDNFQRDLHPDVELIIWEYIAYAYKMNVKSNPNWNVVDKINAFKRLLLSTLK